MERDQRILQRMRERLELRSRGRLSLPDLVADLEHLISGLENISSDKRQGLRARWEVLEEANAVVMDAAERGEEVDDDRVSSITSSAICDMMKLVQEASDSVGEQ